MRLLVIEDDARLAGLLQRGLGERGHAVELAANAEQAEPLALCGDYDALVVDWRLPGRDGRTLVAHLRALGVATPVLMLTALSDVDHRVAGLDAGADDYLAKPFAFDELAARLRAIARRAQRGLASSMALSVGPLKISVDRMTATVDEVPVDLRPKEFLLLVALAERAGSVITRTTLAEHVWGDPYTADTAIDAAISSLRRRLRTAAGHAEHAPRIETMRGVGYRLVVPPPP
ncbi:MAG: response regulator transcription factor [Rubricoccaceae bacterium]